MLRPSSLSRTDVKNAFFFDSHTVKGKQQWATCVAVPEPVPGPGEANEEREKAEEPVQLFLYLNMVHLVMITL